MQEEKEYIQRCPRCGTIFNYTKDDIELSDDNSKQVISCIVTCPQCGIKTHATFIKEQ